MICSFFKRVIKKYKFKNKFVKGDKCNMGPGICIVNNGRKDNIIVGNNCRINGVLLSVGDGKIIIGDNFYLGAGSHIGSAKDIRIGDNVIISNHVKIYDNNNHPTLPKLREEMSKNYNNRNLWSWQMAEKAPVIIEDNVWIGEYAAILKGVKIGKGSIIGMHAVVTKNVPELSVVAGNPAKVVKKLTE